MSITKETIQFGKIIINALNHIIPNSARSFRSNKMYKPMVESAVFINNESIFNNTDKTNHHGVIVESDDNHCYCRIGDSRLTFIQLDIPVNIDYHINCHLIRNVIHNHYQTNILL